MISNQIGTGNINLVDHETLKRIIEDVLGDIGSVKSTLGPGGKANLIHDAGTTSLYQSKDGYRIVMDMHYNDYFYDAVSKLIKDASAHNNAIIGDGTTSAVVILEAFYKKLEKVVSSHAEGFEHISLTGVVNILEALKVVLKEELISNGYINFLNKFDVDVQKKIIVKVATIAANNDRTIGEYCAKLFDKIIEEQSGEQLFVEITPNYANDTSENNEVGFHMPHSYYERIFTTEPDRSTAKYTEPRFLMIEGAITDAEESVIMPVIDYVCGMQEQPLVIVASDYSSKIQELLYKLRLGGTIFEGTDKQGRPMQFARPEYKILPIIMSVGDDESHERYGDLEATIGGHAIPAVTQTWDSIGSTPTEWERVLGRSERIICVEHETSIIGGYGDPDVIKARAKQLEDELKHMQFITDMGASELRKARYQDRLGMLKSNMVAIRVGGDTFKERQYNCLVYEDAIYAVNSTIRNGFTLAGQTSLRHLVTHRADEITDKVIEKLHAEGRNVTFGIHRDDALKSAIHRILEVIAETINTAYEQALANAIFDKDEIEEIKKKIYDSELKKPISYNLMTADTEELDLNEECNMLVAGNTDYETFSAIVGITSIFLNTDNLETLYIPVRATPEEIAIQGRNKA